MFQFAQTVEQDAWEDEKRRKDLEVRPVLSRCNFLDATASE